MPTHEERGSAVVAVGGSVFDRMLSLNLKRSKKESTCSGTIVLSWPGAEHFNMKEMVAPVLMDGAEGQIILDGQLAARIRFDVRQSKGTPKQYELTLQFRGVASDIVDSSPNHDTGQENRQRAVDIMRKLMEGFKPQLVDMSGGSGKLIERFIVSEGETIERAMRRVGREQSLKFWENPEGNIVVEGKDGTQQGAYGGMLVLGKNFTEFSVKRDLSPRYSQMGLQGNGIPTDDNYGEDNENQWSEGQRESVAGGRVLRGLIEGDQDRNSIQDREQMEGDMRSGQGQNVTLKLSTWTNNSGTLWAINQMYHVSIPIDQVNGMMQVIEVEFELTPDSRSATITLESDGASGGAGNVLFDQRSGMPMIGRDEQPYEPPGADETATASQRQMEEMQRGTDQWRQNWLQRNQRDPPPGV